VLVSVDLHHTGPHSGSLVETTSEGNLGQRSNPLFVVLVEDHWNGIFGVQWAGSRAVHDSRTDLDSNDDLLRAAYADGSLVLAAALVLTVKGGRRAEALLTATSLKEGSAVHVLDLDCCRLAEVEVFGTCCLYLSAVTL
jgi:hypothetical protein